MSKRTILNLSLSLTLFIFAASAATIPKTSEQNIDDPFAEARSLIKKTLEQQKVPGFSFAEPYPQERKHIARRLRGRLSL
jgi:hypothetical protein